MVFNQVVEQGGKIVDRRSLHRRILGQIVPASELDGFKCERFISKIVDLRLGHQPALVMKALERSR